MSFIYKYIKNYKDKQKYKDMKLVDKIANDYINKIRKVYDIKIAKVAEDDKYIDNLIINIAIMQLYETSDYIRLLKYIDYEKIKKKFEEDNSDRMIKRIYTIYKYEKDKINGMNYYLEYIITKHIIYSLRYNISSYEYKCIINHMERNLISNNLRYYILVNTKLILRKRIRVEMQQTEKGSLIYKIVSNI